jgi:hypothetical protein
VTVAEATSPAPVFTASTVSTTASFTPPANSLLVAVCNLGASSGTATGAVTDSLSGVWTLRARQNASGSGSAEIWVRDVGATPSAMTVTLTGSTGNSSQLSVRVVTGAGAVAQQQVGATAVKTTSPADIPITAVAAGSLVYTSMVYTSAAQVLAVDANTTAILSTQDSANGQTNGSAKRTALTSGPGAVTVGWTNTVAAEAVAVEIIAPLASTPPSLRATSAGNTGTNATATSFTIAQPTGLAVGDVCLLWVHMAAITKTATATGFSAVTAVSGSTQSTQLLSRTITGAESWPLTVTLSAGVPASGVIYAVQGAAGFDPTPSVSGQTNTASTTITVAGVTTTQADDLLVWFAGVEGTSGNAPPTITKPAAMTARSTQSSSSATTAVNSGSMCADLVQVTAGATGNQNGTSSASRANSGMLVALSPATGGPPVDTGVFAGAATAGMTVAASVKQLAGVTLAGGAALTVTATTSTPGGPTVYVSDTFTATNGTGLSSHTPDIGGAWSGGGPIQGNQLTANFFNQAFISNAIGAATADYEVAIDVVMFGASAGQDRLGAIGRGNFGGGNWYLAYYDASAQLVKLSTYSSAAETILGSFALTYVQGQTHNVKLRMNGSTISCLVDGTTQISVTDTSHVSADALGIHQGDADDSLCLNGDNFVAQSLAATVDTGTVALAATAGMTVGATSGAPVPAVVQEASVVYGSAGPPFVKAFPANVTAGNLLLALTIIGINGFLVTGVTDSQGNTWTQADQAEQPSTSNQGIWYAIAGSTGACTVTVAANNSGGMHIMEVSNIRATSPLTAHGNATSAAATPVVGPNLSGLSSTKDFVIYWSGQGTPSAAATGSPWTDTARDVLVSGPNSYTEAAWTDTGPTVTAPTQVPGTSQSHTIVAAAFAAKSTAPPKFGTLIDTFTGSSLNPSVWSFSGSNVAIASNQLQMSSSLTATEYQCFTQGFYDLTNSQLMLQLANVGNEAINSWENYVILQDSGGTNRLYWYVLQGFIAAYKTVAGTGTQVYSAGYNSTTYQWLRIREASGTTYWEYSADGINWTIAHSEADPITETALRLLIQAGCYNVESSTTASLYDNVNSPPAIVAMAATSGLSITAGALFGPNYDGTAIDLGDGTGAWANPTNAIGVPDSFYAVWTAP